jgi:flagellin-like hook-associated protein FlgL
MASSITINSNQASLTAQRRLGQSTASLQQSYTRLSSGLRINNASDDAAGLAIASSLSVDALVFTQGVRNLNDSVSLLNIAEGALTDLSSITIRLRELATQSANGTLALVQRSAMDDEADALVDEFNRIVASTKFNSSTILSAASTHTTQAGYGSGGQLSFALAAQLSRAVGDGSFTAANSVAAGTYFYTLELYDFNRDGSLDLALPSDDGVLIQLGNGNGTFKQIITYASNGSSLNDLEISDFDGDGIADIVASTNSDDAVFFFHGNGN